MKNYHTRKRSERGSNYDGRKGRDSGRPTMHNATCNNCGKECEVPFKPTGGKPIYCSNCFEKNQNEEPKKYGRDRKFSGGDTRNRSFEPTKDRDTDQLKKEFGILNKKLDKITKILMQVISEDNYQEEFDEEIEEPKPRKKTKRK